MTLRNKILLASVLFAVLLGASACTKNTHTPPKEPTNTEANARPLNLSLFVTSEYMVLGGWGGFQPNVYFRIAKQIKLGEEWPFEFWAIQKESEEDPGRTIWAVYANDRVYLDSNKNFLALPGEGSLGDTPPEALKKPAGDEAANYTIRPLHAHDVIAKDLSAILKDIRIRSIPDVGQIALVLDTMFTENNMKALRPLAQAIKDAGYPHITLKYFEGGDAVLREVRSVNEIKDALITPPDSLLQKFYDILGIEIPKN